MFVQTLWICVCGSSEIRFVDLRLWKLNYVCSAHHCLIYGPVKYITVCFSKQLIKTVWLLINAQQQTRLLSSVTFFYPIQMSFKPCNTVFQPIKRPQYATFQPQCQETHAY